uniref:Uncharacterized protein n=1 Tax=Arundo donax TaxID=35708 RepID=A0A0A8ZVI0_ARUDO
MVLVFYRNWQCCTFSTNLKADLANYSVGSISLKGKKPVIVGPQYKQQQQQSLSVPNKLR